MCLMEMFLCSGLITFWNAVAGGLTLGIMSRCRAKPRNHSHRNQAGTHEAYGASIRWDKQCDHLRIHAPYLRYLDDIRTFSRAFLDGVGVDRPCTKQYRGLARIRASGNMCWSIQSPGRVRHDFEREGRARATQIYLSLWKKEPRFCKTTAQKLRCVGSCVCVMN